ncbi:hypothetical protein BHM03_00013267 [Ensete ventricosum]|uniref:NAC domain-containing protein n=1 Tax=Ensete ventricosum TaxID=4639 RepID=A0A445MDT8_ENSVE|nr:hypothetical protein BHM03_00013267 [Ensete ventricosum]
MENLSALPPGFGFHPTDVELVSHYLKRKTQGHNFDELIPEVDIYKHEPWDLPGNFVTYPGFLCFYCWLMLSIVDMIIILIFGTFVLCRVAKRNDWPLENEKTEPVVCKESSSHSSDIEDLDAWVAGLFDSNFGTDSNELEHEAVVCPSLF